MKIKVICSERDFVHGVPYDPAVMVKISWFVGNVKVYVESHVQ